MEFKFLNIIYLLIFLLINTNVSFAKESNTKTETKSNNKTEGVYKLANSIDGLKMEDWYPILKDYTAETFFMDIKLEEIESMISLYRTFRKKKNTFDELDAKILRNMEDRLNTRLQEIGFEGFFIKLPIRSCKEGIPSKTAEIEKMNEEMTNDLRNSYKPEVWGKELSPQDLDDNFKLHALMTTAFKALKCRNAEDAINLLTSSFLAFQDMVIHTQIYIPENKTGKELKYTFAIRSFENRLRLEREFRCFVKNGRMVGISQFYYLFIIQEYQYPERVAEIKEKLVTFHDKFIKPLMTHMEEYVIDLVLFDDGTVNVIEPNPYHLSDGRLIKVDDEKDQEILAGKVEETVIRVTKTVPSDLHEIVVAFEQKLVKMNSHRVSYDFIKELAPDNTICYNISFPDLL